MKVSSFQFGFCFSMRVKPECGEKPLVLATQDIPKKCSNVNGTSQSAAHVHSDDVFGGIRRDSALQLLAGKRLLKFLCEMKGLAFICATTLPS